MAHARQQIRDQIVTTVTSLATTGASVFSSLVYPVDTLPSLVVTTPRERRLEDDAIQGDGQLRELEVLITARCRVVDTADDTLDTICAEVETAMAADQQVSTLAKLITLESTDTEFSADAEQPTGQATMLWRCVYRVASTDPTTIIA